MKIAHINAVCGKSSTGLIVKDIHTLCVANGINSVVCTSKGHADIKIGNPISNTFHAILTRLFGLQGFGSYFSTLCFIIKLRKYAPDIVHLHNVHNNCLHLPLLFDFLKKHRISVVLTLHDSWYFTGKCYHFLDIGCERWQTICHDCPKRYNEIPSYVADLSKSVFKRKKHIFNYNKLYTIGCSKWITSCAKSSPILRKASFYQIYNGLDTTVFNPNGIVKRDIRSSANFIIMVMANKWFDSSNSSLVTELLSRLSELGKLLIVGCDDERLNSYGGNSNVQCLGFIRNREELASIYRSVDVFLNVTHVDTLPTVNMEAACCGTPIVTYDSGGSGELVIDGQTGYVVMKNDIQGIIDSLYKVKEGRISRKSCSDWAMAEFDRNIAYMRYIDLYRSIIKE